MTEVMRMHNPPHPGECLRELWMDPTGLSLDEVSKMFELDVASVEALMEGKLEITEDMAKIIGRETFTTPESWLIQQHNYNCWQKDHPSA